MGLLLREVEGKERRGKREEGKRRKGGATDSTARGS